MKTNLNTQLNIKGQTILIIGNWSYKNLGDELILLGTVKLLLQQKKLITISCYDPQRLKTFFSQFIDTKQITFIHELPKGFKSTFKRFKKGGLKELKYFRKTDTVILGGGEILTEENPSAYRYWLVGMRPFLLKVIARRSRRSNPKQQHTRDCHGSVPPPRNNNLYIMGGVQIPTSKFHKKLLRFLLNHTTHLYLRDFQAVEEIKAFGYPNTEFFMDTSYFAYERPVIAKKYYDGSNPNDNKYIIVNLNKNGEKFLDEIAKDIKEYLKNGYTIYYVPVAKGQNTYYNDLQYKQQLQQLVIESESRKLGLDLSDITGEAKQSKKNHIQILDWEENFNQFIQILKGAELVISTRLHLFLIASFLGVPTKVYPYQRKILKMQEVIKKLSNDKQK